MLEIGFFFYVSFWFTLTGSCLCLFAALFVLVVSCSFVLLPCLFPSSRSFSFFCPFFCLSCGNESGTENENRLDSRTWSAVDTWCELEFRVMDLVLIIDCEL